MIRPLLADADLAKRLWEASEQAALSIAGKQNPFSRCGLRLERVAMGARGVHARAQKIRIAPP
jgi:hypothetical protein